MNNSVGFLYIATGSRYIRESVYSAATFKSVMPEIPIALFTDDASAIPAGSAFSEVRTIFQSNHDFGDKILPLKDSPFQKTVFLDTDTYCVAPCRDMFEILDRFDCAAVHAPYRECWHHPTLSVPDCFPELNTGVIAYHNQEPFQRFVDDWQETYVRFRELMQRKPAPNQPAFRDALYRSAVKFYVLPSEYNTRSCFPYFIGGNSFVRILHARGVDMDESLRLVRMQGNKRLGPRVVDIALGGRTAKKQ